MQVSPIRRNNLLDRKSQISLSNRPWRYLSSDGAFWAMRLDANQGRFEHVSQSGGTCINPQTRFQVANLPPPSKNENRQRAADFLPRTQALDRLNYA